MTSIEVKTNDQDIDMFPQSESTESSQAETVAEHVPQSPDEERKRLYEMGKDQVFNYIEPLKKKVQKLTKSVKEVENTDEAAYTKRLEDLRIAEQSLNGILKFENKLWGNSVEEYLESIKTIGADVKSIHTKQDIEDYFEEWGALPGATDLERPFVHKDIVLDFVDTVSDLSEEEARKRAGELFSNATVREKMLSFWKPEGADSHIYEQGMAVTDGSENDDELEEKPSEIRFPEISVSEKKEDESQEEVKSPYDQLVEEESKLIEAKEVIGSKMFRFAPFLMKFTKQGKKDLQLLKQVGLNREAIGRSGGNLEIARALRLKSVREKLGHMDKESATAFMHSKTLRENIEKAPKAGKLLEDIKEDLIEKKEMKAKDTRRRNVKNIKKVIHPEN